MNATPEAEQAQGVEGATDAPKDARSVPAGALLTESMRRFAVELFKGADKTDAYQRAYPSCVSRKEAGNRGRKLARHPNVVEYLTALKAQTLDYSDVSTTQIKRELAYIALSDIRRLFDPMTGEILPIEQWPNEVAAAVSSYEEEVSANGQRLKRKIRLWDKPGALKLLADIKHMTNAKPDATQRASFVFNFGTGRGLPRGRMAGRVIDHDPAPLSSGNNAPK